MNIIIGVTSGIACYKVVDLIEKLKNNNIFVIQTKNSINLISPSILQKAAKNKVAIDLFNKNFNYKHYLKNNKLIKHISLADKADLVIIAPATANFIGKLAGGLADDLLTTTVMATKAPVLICPSMNVNMWNNKIVQENIKKLKKRGYHFIDPEHGMLACGYKGIGRLAGLDKITHKANLLIRKKDLISKRILITAGPTEEAIDPIRVITNRSSGKMGYSLAESAMLRGAKVTLISGPSNLQAPSNIEFVSIRTAEELRKELLKRYDNCDIVIMAAAVSDFKTVKLRHKIKKQNSLTLNLIKNADILKEIGKKKRHQMLIGFSLESKDLIKNALLKLKEKNLDYIIANKVKTLGSDRSDFTVICKDYKRKFLNISKLKMADNILDLK